jgi:hypothetical protein
MAKSSVQLCLGNLGYLDRGATQLVVDQALAKAVADTEDRGDDGKPRVVTIKVSTIKLKSGMVEVALEASLSLPTFRINPTAAQPRMDYQTKQLLLDFQPMSPGNPAQEEIPYDDSEVK